MLTIVFFVTLIFLTSSLEAVEYTYSLNSSYQNSNNISQLTGGQSGQSTDVGLGFSLANSLQKEWDINLNGQLDRIFYSGNDLTNETNTNLQGAATYKSLTNNFSLTALTDMSQAPVNRFQTQTVNNTRDQYVYAIMPSYFFSINPSDRINTSYSFVDFNLEDVPRVQAVQVGQASSSTDQNFLINYAKRLNATNTLAFNARTGKINFDDDISQGVFDYDRDDLFLSWVVAGQTDQIQIEFGKSKIKDQLSRIQKLDYRLASYTRQLNRTNTVSLSYSDGFNNPLSNVQATNTIAVNQQNNNITAAQRSKQYGLTYTVTGDSLTTNINLSDNKLSQSFTQNGEDRKSYSLNITYALSRILNDSGRSNIAINYTKSSSDFNSVVTNIAFNNILNYGVGYNYVYSSKLIFSLSYDVRKTSQFTTNNVETIIDSKSTFLMVTYSDRGRF